MHLPAASRDPLALTTGLPARLVAAVGVVVVIWGVAGWALGVTPTLIFGVAPSLIFGVAPSLIFGVTPSLIFGALTW